MDDEERGFRQSLWQETSPADFQCPPLEADQSCDVVIVGGGFTGLSAALHLRELGKSVVVLEARDIGWGASGRNGGQVNPAGKLLPSEIIAHYGESRGRRIVELLDGACDMVFDLIARHKIECAPRRTPFFRAGQGARGLHEVEDWVREWGDFGAPVSFKNKAETHELLGSSFFDCGMEDARGGSLQPLSYARGLARAAVAAGAQIFTHTKANRIDKNKSDWVVACENSAKISAQFLLIATNGYTDDLWPGLKKQVVPVASLQAATSVLPQEIRAHLLPGGHHVSDTRRVMNYFRVDETGRFQIGGRGSAMSPAVQQADTRHLQAQACKIFPQLEGVDWDFEWGGLVAITKTHVPNLIELGENAFAGMGYDGRGVATATCMGKQLADLIAGEDVALPRDKLSPFAFHEFRNAGIAWHIITGRLRDIF